MRRHPVTKLLLSTAAAVLIAFAPAHAETLTKEQKAEINTLVEQFILDNPQVMIKSFENHRLAQEKALEEEGAAEAKKLVAELDKAGYPSVGAEKPDVKVIEFMDYNCGYCKKAFEEVAEILKEDKKVRFYFIDMPILGPTSLEAAKWALAAQKQGKYFEYHTALMKHQGPKNDSVLESKAKEVGLDVKKLKKDKDSEDIQQKIDANNTRANLMSITGTPGFVIGDSVVRGYLTLDQMKEAIAEQRNPDKADKAEKTGE